MSIETRRKSNPPEANASPVDGKSPADWRLRAVAFAICILFSAVVWVLVFRLF